MKKNGIYFALIVGVSWLFLSIPFAHGGESPQELNKKAYFLVREARKALYQKKDRQAYDSFVEAGAAYELIARQYPEWQADSIRIKIEQCRKEAEKIGEKIFQLPEGYLKIESDMVREGTRYDKGRAIAGKVQKTGENEYKVEKCTVTLAREGPLIGASCSGPDYTYRGRKYGFACKHIWAVVFKEKLLKQQGL
ncbi:MAG: hypothetical protein U9N73_10460 [Candidatus Auribacterota bacterium]|nr:hypothetical protein [Candidatus Auribacterota bacterium]